MDSLRAELPAELFADAVHPALPAVPTGVLLGRDNLTGAPRVQRFDPMGGHAMLDLYLCACLPGVLERVGPEASDLELDEATRLAWRLAVSALRTRPLTRVPAGLPAGGLP
jgi:hypothetical protein